MRLHRDVDKMLLKEGCQLSSEQTMINILHHKLKKITVVNLALSDKYPVEMFHALDPIIAHDKACNHAHCAHYL